MRKTNKTTRKTSKTPRKHQGRKPRVCNFESLEVRQLMATINVNDFGARANDGGDDRAAVLAAMNASKAGDTILFPGGTYNISSAMPTKGDRTYTGQNGATLVNNGGDRVIFHISENNVRINRLTLQGQGIETSRGDGQMVAGLNVDNVKFNVTGRGNITGLEFGTGLRNSSITNNSFFIGGENGIYGYYWDNLVIANNEFLNPPGDWGGEGIHVIDCGTDSRNLLVEQNYFSGLHRMGIEYQGGGNNTIIQDNYYENPVVFPNFNSNNDTFAYSIICDKSVNTITRRNFSRTYNRADGVGTRIVFEIGGNGAITEDNYSDGGNHVVSVNGGSGAQVRNNKFVGYLQGPGVGGSGRNATFYNNGPNVNLTWDINRGRPYPNRRYGNTPLPPPPSTETAPDAPTGLAAVSTGATTVNLFWSDKAYNETGYKIERSSDGTNWSQIASIGADSTSYTATGLTAGQAYSFRVRAVNATGNSGYSNVAAATPAAIDPKNGIPLSDLAWSSAKNGWGPAERDMSNGEQAAGDGRMLTLNRKSYAKGLGVHAGSEIHYQLDGKYSNFLSDIGLDDEQAPAGSVVFEVWADGKRLYSSGIMTAATLTKSINVNVSGKQELMLVVSNAGDTSDSDHADWANARLMVDSTPAPAPAPDPDPVPEPDPLPLPVPAQTIALSDLDWTSVTNGWGTPELNKSNGERHSHDGRTLSLAGKTYANGIGAHSNSEIHYALDGNYSTFISDIGVDDEVGDRGSVVFQVWADGVKLYESGTMTGADATKSINVNVQGRQEMWLVVTSASDGKDFDHADWAGARLSLKAQSAGTALSSKTASSQLNGWGPLELNRSVGEQLPGDGSILRLNGKTYTSGIGAHSNSKLVYELGGEYSTFTSDIGVDDEVGDRGSVVFQVWADGVKLYDSGLVSGGSATKTAVVNVAGKSQLWLIVDDAGDGKDFDHADWADARLAA